MFLCFSHEMSITGQEGSSAYSGHSETKVGWLSPISNSAGPFWMNNEWNAWSESDTCHFHLQLIGQNCLMIPLGGGVRSRKCSHTMCLIEGELKVFDEQRYQFATALKIRLSEDHWKPAACITHHYFHLLLQISAQASLQQTTPSAGNKQNHPSISGNQLRQKDIFRVSPHSRFTDLSNLDSARRPEYNTARFLKDVHITSYSKSGLYSHKNIYD